MKSLPLAARIYVCAVIGTGIILPEKAETVPPLPEEKK